MGAGSTQYTHVTVNAQQLVHACLLDLAVVGI